MACHVARHSVRLPADRPEDSICPSPPAFQLLADGRLAPSRCRLGPALEQACRAPCPDACAYVCPGGGDSPFAGTFWAVQRSLSFCPFCPAWPSGKPCLSQHSRSRVLSRFALEESLSRPSHRTIPAALQARQKPLLEQWRRLPAASDPFPPSCPLPCAGIAHGAALGIALCAVSELSVSPSGSLQHGARAGRAQWHQASPPTSRPRKTVSPRHCRRFCCNSARAPPFWHSSCLCLFRQGQTPQRTHGTPLMQPPEDAAPRCAGWPAGLGCTASFFTTATPRRQMRCRPSSG